MAKLRPALTSVPTRVSMASEFVNCSGEQFDEEEQEVKVYNVSAIGLQNIPQDLEDQDGVRIPSTFLKEYELFILLVLSRIFLSFP